MAIEQVLALPTDMPEAERPRVRIAGRIVSRRVKGKLHFLDLWDSSGRPTMRQTREVEGKREAAEVPGLTSQIQVMLGQRQVGETGWAIAQELDLGDLIGVDGTFGKTKMGEPTVFADGLTFLTKSLEPHPSSFYGMHDEES